MDWKISKAVKGLRGEVRVPPDKSVSHRSVMFGAVSSGDAAAGRAVVTVTASVPSTNKAKISAT